MRWEPPYAQMRLEDCDPGVPVWYHPSSDETRFEAVIDERPWMLGETPVMRLRELPPAYSEYTKRKTPRTTVPAAALFALEARQVEGAVDPGGELAELKAGHAR